VDSKARAAFAALIAAQALHSVEEYRFRLFDVFGPARFASGLVSGDRALGFTILNTGIVLLGVVGYLFFVRPAAPGARAVAFFWTGLELANGTIHLLLAAAQRGYFPGAYTAPFLAGISAYLAVRLLRGVPA
jgi:hypothetical protein